MDVLVDAAVGTRKFHVPEKIYPFIFRSCFVLEKEKRLPLWKIGAVLDKLRQLAQRRRGLHASSMPFLNLAALSQVCEFYLFFPTQNYRLIDIYTICS